MITKGIKNPVTGEIAKVQGAGTVYDENKNAIKHGVGLVSSGHNQVIHGRHNAPNAAMEEIVGGGYGPDTYRITVKGFDWDNNDHNFPTPPGINQDAFIQPAVLIIQKITTQMDAKFDWYIVIEVIQQAITNGDKTTKSVSYHGIVEGDIRVGDTIDIITYESAGYSSITVHRFDYIDGILYHKDGTKLPNNYIDINHNDDEVIEGFCDCGDYILSKEEVTASNDNIRTLDWQGNETIKGTFVAGKDIQFKDILDRDVSLREMKDTLDELSQKSECCNTKADKVTNATEGNLAGLDNKGNLTDSGYKPSDFVTASDLSGKLDDTNIVVDLDVNDGVVTEYYEDDEFSALFASERIGKNYVARVYFTHNSGINYPFLCIGRTVDRTSLDGYIYAYLTFGQKTLIFTKSASTGVITIDKTSVSF